MGFWHIECVDKCATLLWQCRCGICGDCILDIKSDELMENEGLQVWVHTYYILLGSSLLVKSSWHMRLKQNLHRGTHSHTKKSYLFERVACIPQLNLCCLHFLSDTGELMGGCLARSCDLERVQLNTGAPTSWAAWSQGQISNTHANTHTPVKLYACTHACTNIHKH